MGAMQARAFGASVLGPSEDMARWKDFLLWGKKDLYCGELRGKITSGALK